MPSPRPCCRDTACPEHWCSVCLGYMLVYGGLDNPGGSALGRCRWCQGTGLEPEGAR